MAVAFVDDAEVVNGTAGTSVVVARPAGAGAGHLLVAFVAATGTPTISTPTGWTPLTGSPQDASTSVRMAAFYREADGTEPASWTWTLGTSQRNWGWVGAYSGVRRGAPIHASQGSADTTAGTGFQSLPTVQVTTGALGLSAVAAVRTASGSATTWTGSSQSERADMSTNGGAGTDIAGMVQDTAYAGLDPGAYGPSWTASQSQTAGAMWGLSLEPAFIAYDGGEIEPVIEAAFGADPDGDPDEWVWTDITADAVDVGTPVVITTGRDDRGGIDEELASTKVSLRLQDTTGKYMPENPNGLYWPNIVEDTPIRVRLPFGYVTPSSRATVLADRWSPSWDDSAALAFVDVAASGRLQRARNKALPVKSALHRRMLGQSTSFVGSGIRPHAYYPLEEGSGATRAASALPGHQPLQISGGVSFGSASDLAGSDPLPTVAEDGVIGGALGPGYTATGQWAVMVAIKLPEAPVGVESRLISVRCTGTALDWSLWMVPGSPNSLNIRAHAYGGTVLLNAALGIVEADHYGKWRLYTILVAQDGADVDYIAHSAGPDGAVSTSGTLAGRTIGAARSVRIVAFAALAGMGVGHLALYTDPTFTTIDVIDRAFSGLEGSAGDLPPFRFQRLCQEESIPFDMNWDVDGTNPPMGPQKSRTIGDLLQEAADTDHGLLHDARTNGEVYLAALATLYNQDPALTLDGNLRQIPTSLRPTTDGQSKITDSTVSRDGGSSARYVASNVRGNRPDGKTLSLETDQHLYQIAGFRTALGNAGQLRYTQVPLNLRASPELAEAWMNCTIGSRVKAINLPATHGPTEVDGILVGWREEISADWWMVYMNLASARPYDVPVMESGDEKTWRLDMEGSTLATAASSGDSSLLVACSGDARWGSGVPYDLDVNGERMTATAVASAATDTFNRTTSNGWGTSNSGHTWTVSGGSVGDFFTSPNTGRITNNSTGVLRGALLNVGSTDVDFGMDLLFPNTNAATAAYERFLIGRATDLSNHYGLMLQLGTAGGTVTMIAFKRVGGVFTSLASKTAGTNAAGNFWRGTVHIVGDPGATTLYVTARNLSTGAARVALRVPLLNDPTLTGTNIGAADQRATGNTDAAIVGQWDALDVTMPQRISVTRAVAGGANAKAHAAGTTVRLWRARGLAL